MRSCVGVSVFYKLQLWMNSSYNTALILHMWRIKLFLILLLLWYLIPSSFCSLPPFFIFLVERFLFPHSLPKNVFCALIVFVMNLAIVFQFFLLAHYEIRFCRWVIWEGWNWAKLYGRIEHRKVWLRVWLFAKEGKTFCTTSTNQWGWLKVS